MAQYPLHAFEGLNIEEIRHIVDVMRSADLEENEDHANDSSTIKRGPKLKFRKSKKKEQQTTHDGDIDTNNNNTLKRNDNPEHIYNNDTLQLKQEISSSATGIPSVPRVHMGAGFMKIFNQCPLDIHSSYCWTNNDTKGESKARSIKFKLFSFL